MRAPIFAEDGFAPRLLGFGLAIAMLGVPAAAPFAQPSPADSVPNTASSVPAGSVGGMGDINLFPRRIVMNGRQRIATVGLYNKAVQVGDYEIRIDDMMMTPDGRLIKFSSVDDPAAKAKVKTASQMLRWSPRRVTLLANESQTIRVMARPPADLPDGEYRSHFTVVSIPAPEDSGFSIEDAVTGQAGADIGVQITPRFAIAIPVIMRVGETTLTTGISDVSIIQNAQGAKAFRFTISREGTRSAYGDITVSASGFAVPVGLIKGMGLYPEIDQRVIILPVNSDADPRALNSGTKLTISYVDDDFEVGNMLAEHTYIVP